MRKELRISKNGTQYYSFIHYDTDLQRTIRLSKQYVRNRFGKDLITEEEAEDALKLLAAETTSSRLRMSKRSEWEKEFYSFSKLLESYSEWQKKKAPNSFENNIHYLRHYVLHYFLVVAQCNNVEGWSDFFEPFRDWLEKDAKLIKKPTKLISYASKNHCVRTLNTFMRHLHKLRRIDRLILCESFPEHKIKQRTVDDVITAIEMEAVYRALKRGKHTLEAAFFRLLYFTGMRFNEGLGLSIDDVYEGEIEHSTFKNKVELHKLKYSGYIVLSSQPSHRTRNLRGLDGHILRKPLKGKKGAQSDEARIIIITDHTLWNDLTELYNHSVEELERKTWGANVKDYALFEGINKATSTRRLKGAFEECSLRYRSWHCCRHSCATNLIGTTGDQQLVMLWLGHSSPRVFKRYNHIYESIVRSAKKKEEGGRIRKFKRV